MESKYYIPSIEEFHVGFKFEQYHKPHWDDTGRWFNCSFDTSHSISRITNELQQDRNWVRVKYLDKQDIESLGFTTKEDLRFINGDYTILKYNNAPSLDPLIIENEATLIITLKDYTIFSGKIKNKSELKVLLTQLGILNNESAESIDSNNNKNEKE